MEKARKGKSLSDIQTHLCGIMVTSLFFGERLQFLGVPLYGLLIIAYMLVRLWGNHFKIQYHGIKNFSFTRAETFAIFWILVASIMLPLSARTAGTKPYTYALITGLSIAIVSLAIKDRADLEIVMKYAMVGVFITLAATSYELITGNHLYTFTEYYTRLGRNSAFAFQVNPNDNATVLVACVFIVIFFLRKHKILSSILIAWIVAATLRTGARLAVYTLFILGVEVVLLLVLSKLSGRHSSVTKFANVFLFVFVAVALSLSFSIERFLQLFSSSRDYVIDYNRFVLMRRALGTITPLSFLLGNGSGVTMLKIGYENIHSVLVEILCDNGILVVVWLLYFVIRLFFSYTDNIPMGSKVVLPCFATAFVLMCFESSSMLRIHPVWVLLAIMWRLYQINSIENGADLNPQE